MKKKNTTEEQALKDRIMSILERSTSEIGLTEDSISAILVLETEIKISRVLIDNILDGTMTATYPETIDSENRLLDLFKYQLTPEGKKRIKKQLDNKIKEITE